MEIETIIAIGCFVICVVCKLAINYCDNHVYLKYKEGKR